MQPVINSFNLVPFIRTDAVQTKPGAEPDFHGSIMGAEEFCQINAFRGIRVCDGVKYLALEILGSDGKPWLTGQLFRDADVDGEMQYWGMLQQCVTLEDDAVPAMHLQYRLRGRRVAFGTPVISVQLQALSERDKQFQKDAFSF